MGKYAHIYVHLFAVTAVLHMGRNVTVTEMPTVLPPHATLRKVAITGTVGGGRRQQMIDYSVAIPSTVTQYQAADTITLNVELGSHRTETPFIVSTLCRSLFPSHPVTEASGSHK